MTVFRTNALPTATALARTPSLPMVSASASAPAFAGPAHARLRPGLLPLHRDERESMLSLDVVDMDSELAYWRSHYRGLVPRTGLRYSDHEPAVKLGLDAYMRAHGRDVGQMQEELRACYQRTRGGSRLEWEEARPVVEAVWRRLQARGEDR